MTIIQSINAKGAQVRVTGYRPAKVGTLVAVRRIGRTWYGVIRFPDGEAEFRLKWLRPA
jgi:hypothetical protein